MRAVRVKEHESANDRITARVPHATRSIIELAIRGHNQLALV
ncbi:MAG: hypothetical protein WCR46_14600 [Deltaproteobacteria bacterium]